MVCVSFCVTAFCCLNIVDIWTIVLKVLKDKKNHIRKVCLPGKKWGRLWKIETNYNKLYDKNNSTVRTTTSVNSKNTIYN